MQPRFSALIRQSFHDALDHPDQLCRDLASDTDLRGLDLETLPRMVRDPSVPLDRQDRLLAAIVRCYRRDRSPGWSALLLEALAPALTLAAAGLAPIARALTSDDVEQELVLATLRVAAAMPLPDPPDRIQRRMTMRASWEVLRALTAAAHRQGAELEGLDAGDACSFDRQKAMFDLAELRADVGDLEDLALALRIHGRGDSYDQVGSDLGLTPEAARSRCRRLTARLRGAAA